MRRVAPLLSLLLLASVACASDGGSPSPSGLTGSFPSGPSGTTGELLPNYTPDGCPVDDAGFCEQASFLANALAQRDDDALYRLSRPGRFVCDELPADEFPGCEPGAVLRGYALADYHPNVFVLPEDEYRNALDDLTSFVDPGYVDELGSGGYRIVGVSTCGPRTRHLVFTVALTDSALPAARFLGTLEVIREKGTWAAETVSLDLYTNWQLVLDEPLSQIACGDVRGWTT